jgi:hypothetical protein
MSNFNTQVEEHLAGVSRTERIMQARIEALGAEKSDLQRRSTQLESEHCLTTERLREKNADFSETEGRIQRLMDRLVMLLSAGSSAHTMQVQFAEVLQELADSEQRLQRQLGALHGQLEAARSENRRAALLLSDEQRRTKRLHDTLCQLQSELFQRHEKPVAPRPSWPPSERMVERRPAADDPGAEMQRQGQPRVALSSSPARLAASTPAYATLDQGDAADDDRLSAAVEGVEAVLELEAEAVLEQQDDEDDADEEEEDRDDGVQSLRILTVDH